jgi:hypothetical protein
MPNVHGQTINSRGFVRLFLPCARPGSPVASVAAAVRTLIQIKLSTF